LLRYFAAVVVADNVSWEWKGLHYDDPDKQVVVEGEDEEHSCMNTGMDSFLVECTEITCLVPGAVHEVVPLKGAPVFPERECHYHPTI